MHLYCENGKKKLVHAGATGYGNNYSPAARRNFKARHHCATVCARRLASPNYPLLPICLRCHCRRGLAPLGTWRAQSCGGRGGARRVTRGGERRASTERLTVAAQRRAMYKPGVRKRASWQGCAMPTKPIGAPPNWIHIGIPGYRFATKLEKIRSRQRYGTDEGGNEKAAWYETIVPGMDRAIRDAIRKWWPSAELRDTRDIDKPIWISTKIAEAEFLRIEGRKPSRYDLASQIRGAPTGITYRSFIFVVIEYILDIVGRRTSTPSIGKAPPLSWRDGLVWPQGSHDHVAHPPKSTEALSDTPAPGVHQAVAEGGAHNKQSEGTEGGKVLSAARAATTPCPSLGKNSSLYM